MESSPTDRHPPHTLNCTRVQSSIYCVNNKVCGDKHKTLVSDKRFWVTQITWRLGANTTADTKPAAIVTSSFFSWRRYTSANPKVMATFFFCQKCGKAGKEVRRLKTIFNTHKQMSRAFKRVYVAPFLTFT